MGIPTGGYWAGFEEMLTIALERRGQGDSPASVGSCGTKSGRRARPRRNDRAQDVLHLASVRIQRKRHLNGVPGPQSDVRWRSALRCSSSLVRCPRRSAHRCYRARYLTTGRSRCLTMEPSSSVLRVTRFDDRGLSNDRVSMTMNLRRRAVCSRAGRRVFQPVVPRRATPPCGQRCERAARGFWLAQAMRGAPSAQAELCRGAPERLTRDLSASTCRRSRPAWAGQHTPP